MAFTQDFNCGAHHARVVNRFKPSPDGVRWEVEITGQGAPFSVPVVTRLQYPVTPGVRFWTAWADPDPKDDKDKQWRDPLVTMPPANRTLYYGATPVRRAEQRRGFPPSLNSLVTLPLATFSEAKPDAGLTLALALDDVMLDLTMAARADGTVTFTRLNHRIAANAPLRFAMDLVAHESGWRGGLRFMEARYPSYFKPYDPKARGLLGTSAYSSGDVPFDAAKMRAMAFTTNWMASFDFPYMGLFVPPVAANEEWERFPGDSRGEYTPGQRGRNGRTSIARMANYAANMRAKGFHVLNYFNVTEFGDHIAWPLPAPQPGSPRWDDPAHFIADHFPAAVMLQPNGQPVYTWGRSVVMDPGEPAYQAFLLDQVRTHMRDFPASDGLCIDRLDWLRLYNLTADDGVTWYEGAPARSLLRSWHQILPQLAKEVHAAGKFVFVNNHLKRADLLPDIDGIFDEHTPMASSLNTTALLCLSRPMLSWTDKEDNLRPDPDAYFQRHLHMGTVPMAPFPANDHSIAPGEWVDRQYLDYGPLMTALRGREWVLTPHAVEVAGNTAKANLFKTPDGFIVPVTFGGAEATITLRGVNAARAEVIHPGEKQWTPLKVVSARSGASLTVPLTRGCAMLRLR